jgi:dienelactone hydrolase
MKCHPIRLAALCTVIVLAGCGGGGTAHDTPATATWQPGVLQGAPVLTASFTAAQLKARLQAGPARDQALLALAGDPVCDVQVHSMQFSTEGGAREQTTSSGAVMVPGGPDPRCIGAKPLVLYAHATHPERSFNLARLDDSANPAYEEALTLAALFASQGFVVVAPNDAGYDTSTLPYHPFLNAQQQSGEMIDAWNAGRNALARVSTQVSAGTKLFLTGYSEGGHVALATLRAMQQAGIAVTASMPMSGPYALAKELDDNFAGQVHVGAPLFGTLIATSYQKAYGTVYASASQLYEPAYASGIETVLPGVDAATLQRTGKLPAAALFSSTPPQAPAGSGLQPALDAITPARGTAFDDVFAHGFGADHLFTNSYRLAYLQDLQAHPDQPVQGLRVAAKANDLRGWTPKSPVLLCGGSADPTVSFAGNTLLMQQQWSALKWVSVLDVDAQPAGTSDPFIAEKLAFGALKGAMELDAQLTSNDPVWEAAQNYHAAVFPFCASAARRFFLAF